MYAAVGVVYLVHVENWGCLNSIYFIVVTLTTVGFGDQSSWDNDGWKDDGVVWFVSCYALIGIMLVGEQVVGEAKSISADKANSV